MTDDPEAVGAAEPTAAADVAEILEFWFGSADLTAAPSPEVQRRWFAGGAAFDAEIAARFGARMGATEAEDGVAEAWMAALAGSDPAGRLTAILVGDQFARNLWRGTARAFSLDGAARRIAAFFLSYAERHAEIIARFGRFPGRNAALGRAATPEEAAWLAAGGETFGQGR